jgi:hypothetical protein
MDRQWYCRGYSTAYTKHTHDNITVCPSVCLPCVSSGIPTTISLSVHQFGCLVFHCLHKANKLMDRQWYCHGYSTAYTRQTNWWTYSDIVMGIPLLTQGKQTEYPRQYHCLSISLFALCKQWNTHDNITVCLSVCLPCVSSGIPMTISDSDIVVGIPLLTQGKQTDGQTVILSWVFHCLHKATKLMDRQWYCRGYSTAYTRQTVCLSVRLPCVSSGIPTTISLSVYQFVCLV